MTPRSSARVRFPKRAVQLHEQVTAAGQQRAPPAGAHLRVKEQPPNLRRSLEIGGERKQLVVERLAEFGARLGKRAQMIGVERLGYADLPEHLAGAANFPRLRVLENEDVKVAALPVLLARE